MITGRGKLLCIAILASMLGSVTPASAHQTTKMAGPAVAIINFLPGCVGVPPLGFCAGPFAMQLSWISPGVWEFLPADGPEDGVVVTTSCNISGLWAGSWAALTMTSGVMNCVITNAITGPFAATGTFTITSVAGVFVLIGTINEPDAAGDTGPHDLRCAGVMTPAGIDVPTGTITQAIWDPDSTCLTDP